MGLLRLAGAHSLLPGDDVISINNNIHAPVDSYDDEELNNDLLSLENCSSEDGANINDDNSEYIQYSCETLNEVMSGEEFIPSDNESIDIDSEVLAKEKYIDEVAAQKAYMRKIEEETFERELRRITVEAVEKGKIAARTTTFAKVSDAMPTASQFVRKKAVANELRNDVNFPAQITLGGELGMSFKFLKRGHKGRLESRQLVVPRTTNLAKIASKQDDKVAQERNLLKEHVLRYERSFEQVSSGNVYINQANLPHVCNRPLLMHDIDRNFGNTNEEIKEKLYATSTRTISEKSVLPHSYIDHKNNIYHSSDKRRLG